MHTSTSLRWLVVAVSAAMLLAVAAACTETVEVPGETVFIEKEVIKEVQVPRRDRRWWCAPEGRPEAPSTLAKNSNGDRRGPRRDRGPRRW